MPTALVTGANSGIGLALSFALARRGYAVIAAMRNVAAGSAALATNPGPGSVRAVTLDVTKPHSIAEALADVSAREGAIDVLVNNAGVSSNAPLEMLDEEHHRLTFETNYWGPVRLMQAVLPQMRERGAGLIINVSSMMRRMPLPGTTPYAPIFQQTRDIQTALLAEPLDADEAAEIMLDAALALDPPFRLLVGRDANTLVPAREAMSDEEWIKLAIPSASNRAALTNRLGLNLE